MLERKKEIKTLSLGIQARTCRQSTEDSFNHSDQTASDEAV